jgi:DNA-binding MarR family transcriptional regulator
VSDLDQGILPGLLGYSLRRAHQRVFQHFAASVGAQGVTPGQVGLLVMVGANPGVSQSALAKSLGVERASLGEAVERLVRRGCLERLRAPGDRRRHALHLTRDGEQFLDRLVPLIRAHERAVADPLSAAERDTLVRLLRRLAGEAPADEAHD